MKRAWVGDNTTASTGLFRINPNSETRRIKPQVGRKVAAHVFSKYTYEPSPERSKMVGVTVVLE